MACSLLYPTKVCMLDLAVAGLKEVWALQPACAMNFTRYSGITKNSWPQRRILPNDL